MPSVCSHSIPGRRLFLESIDVEDHWYPGSIMDAGYGVQLGLERMVSCLWRDYAGHQHVVEVSRVSFMIHPRIANEQVLILTSTV